MLIEASIFDFLAIAIGFPVIIALILSLGFFLGINWNEKTIFNVSRATVVISSVCALIAAMLALAFPVDVISTAAMPQRVHHFGSVTFGNNLELDLTLVFDSFAALFTLLGCFLINLVGHFSARYLHRDAGYLRFFVWYLLFFAGVQTVYMAGNGEVLIAGWEIVGLSSVMLVGFFQERVRPVRNAWIIFCVYRVCDAALLLAIFLFSVASTDAGAFLGVHKLATNANATLVFGAGICLVIAAAGKSAQLPFSFWLPKAMEGPTPSSAIFYGALAVHCGCFLLLRSQQWWSEYMILRVSIILIGLMTALYGSFVGRTRSDIKNMLAYATLAQVGLIFMEIGFGFTTFAVLHMAGHTMMRTYQLLKSPSALREHMNMRKGTSVNVAPTNFRPQAMWIYRLSLAQGYLDEWIDAWLRVPLRQASTHAARWDTFSASVCEQRLARVLAFLLRKQRACLVDTRQKKARELS
jgi:NAD(P)H-quinone oxidoreductase subunit 5